jgi:hypothetical protein
MATSDELLTALINNCRKPEDLIGENGLLRQLLLKAGERLSQQEMKERIVYVQKENR